EADAGPDRLLGGVEDSERRDGDERRVEAAAAGGRGDADRVVDTDALDLEPALAGRDASGDGGAVPPHMPDDHARLAAGHALDDAGRRLAEEERPGAALRIRSTMRAAASSRDESSPRYSMPARSRISRPSASCVPTSRATTGNSRGSRRRSASAATTP